MTEENNLQWIDERMRDKDRARHQRSKDIRTPNLPVIDATKFANQLSSLAETLINKLEREGQGKLPNSAISVDVAVSLRFLRGVYDLIRFINGEQTRFYAASYRIDFSFVLLPLVRTMIDGFSNCARLLDDPTSSKAFRINGLWRMREELNEEEREHQADPDWREYLIEKRTVFEHSKRAEGFTDADLDDRSNTWPLLSAYLGTEPTTDLKLVLRRFTFGIWKQYSAISHASYSGLVELYGIISNDRVPKSQRIVGTEATERLISLHFGRAAGLLLCLLTEIQSFYRFDGAHINTRLQELWNSMEKIPNVDELYKARYELKLTELGR